jgi:LacI family transcriptional regulator
LLLPLGRPPISAVVNDARTIGLQAVRTMRNLLQGQTVAGPVLVPPRGVVARASTDAISIDDPLTAAALRHIRDHCRQRLGVADVARAVGAGRRTLERRFQVAVGRTVAEEILRRRLQIAAHLLRGSDLPIKQVAGRCGFANASHFTQVFLRRHGATPNAWRRSVPLWSKISEPP